LYFLENVDNIFLIETDKRIVWDIIIMLNLLQKSERRKILGGCQTHRDATSMPKSISAFLSNATNAACYEVYQSIKSIILTKFKFYWSLFI